MSYCYSDATFQSHKAFHYYLICRIIVSSLDIEENPKEKTKNRTNIKKSGWNEEMREGKKQLDSFAYSHVYINRHIQILVL